MGNFLILICEIPHQGSWVFKSVSGLRYVLNLQVPQPPPFFSSSSGFLSSFFHPLLFLSPISLPSPVSPSQKPSLRLSPAVAVVTVCSAHQAPAVPKQTVNSLITHPLIPLSFLTSVLRLWLLLPPLTGKPLSHSASL